MNSTTPENDKNENNDRQLTRSGTFGVTTVIRWIGLLPVAIVASWMGYSLGAVFLFLRDPIFPPFLFPLLLLLPSGFALTLTGGLMAPRYRAVIAGGLLIFCSIQSLLIHVLMQPNPGLVNYMNSTGEILGASLGVVAVLIYVRLQRRQSRQPQFASLERRLFRPKALLLGSGHFGDDNCFD